MIRVTVARVGVPNDSTADFPEDDEWRIDWDDREKAQLSVNRDASLGSIIDDALETLGASRYGRAYAIAFRTPEDEDEGVGLGTFKLPVVRDDGTADWKPWADVTLAEALATREHGLVHGDPTQPYAFVLPKIGNGVLPDWPTLLHMLQLLYAVAEHLTVPGGVAATYYLLRGRPREAVRTIEQRATDWSDRGLDPYSLDEYLDAHPWNPADLAAALACSRSEAVALLWALGFAESPSGLWRRSETPEAATMAQIRRLLISTGSRFASDPQLEAELERRLAYLVENGEAPAERDWDELPWLQPTLPGDSALQSRTRGLFHRMLERLGKNRR